MQMCSYINKIKEMLRLVYKEKNDQLKHTNDNG